MDKSIVRLVSDVRIERAREAHMLHELANVSTLGFKRAFEQHGTTVSDGKTVADDSLLSKTLVELKEGPKIYTGNPLDLYMNRDTLLGVLSEDGVVSFTRRGDLKLSPENELILGSGERIASENADPLVVPPNQTISISEEGVIYALDPQQETAEQVEVGRLMLRDASEVGLPLGDFEAGPEPVSVSVGVIEGSTVNAMEVMVELMSHMRSFEMKIKLVKDLDELGESNSTLMRLA